MRRAVSLNQCAVYECAASWVYLRACWPLSQLHVCGVHQQLFVVLVQHCHDRFDIYAQRPAGMCHTTHLYSTSHFVISAHNGMGCL
jgi:hypothetical protein